jgi:hypothetical protein
MTQKQIVNRMKLYKIYMDLSRVINLLKRFNLGEFKTKTPIIFTEADNPDEACHIAYYRFVETILKQDNSTDTSKLIQDISFGVRITKITNS